MTLLRRFRGPLLVIAGAAITTAAFHLAGFRLNLTPSLPRGIYRITEGPIERGTLVAACLPREVAELGRRRGYLGTGACAENSAPVLKLVAATGGDVVELGADVRVNGNYLQPTPPPEDRAGRLLNRYPAGRYELARGEIWLYSPSPHSWDSRFFGPMRIESVVEVVRPIWPTKPTHESAPPPLPIH